MKPMKSGVILLALLLAAMAMIPMVSADEKVLNQTIPSDYTIQHSIQVDSNTPGMTEAEFNAYVTEMKDKYGADRTQGLQALIAGTASIPYPVTSHLTYQNAWTDQLVSGPGGISGSSNCALVLYKATGTDSQGKEHYFYYMWTSALPKNGFNLKEFYNKLQLTNSNSRLISYSPGSTTFANGQPVTVSASTSFGGITYSISQQFTLNQDQVGPMSDSVNGYGGRFGVMWLGNYGYAQEIEGVMHVDIPTGQSISGTWTNDLTSYV
ncbi:MAG: hypothetical protein LUQ31_05040 [Methanoregula sp.]|nr:hypothetical protein [Methanoregula sp.]